VPVHCVCFYELPRFRHCQSERLPHTLCEHASCVVDNMLYVAGGQQRYNCDGRHTTRAVYCFDPRRCSWRQVCDNSFISLIITLLT
jgi:hypothetical protein